MSDDDPAKRAMDVPMNAAAVKRLLQGNTLIAIDPDSRELVATVTYERDGTCAASFPDGDSDTGAYGFVENRYWTQYRRFRSGLRNEFYLVSLGPDRAQAYYADGRRAFVQIIQSSS